MTIDGIALTLLIGPAVPVPAPPDVMDAFESAEITSGTDRSGFQLRFRVGPRSALQTKLLPAGYFDPISTRVIVMVTLRGLPQVLIDGIVTRQEVAPSNAAGQSTLTVTGEDLSLLMDLVEMPFMRFPAQPVVARVYTILAKYAAFGIAPVALPPVIPDFANPLEAVASQTGTDRAYLKKLAGDVGYVFYVQAGPAPGANIAYFGPDVRVPAPQPALAVNMGAHSNVDTLSFSLDGMAKKVVVMTVMDPVTRRTPVPVPVPNLSLLRPPMGLRPTLPSKVEFPSDAARLAPDRALSYALALSFKASDAITCSGTLDVLRYGHVLRSRMTVGVRGAGLAYDGFYYVNSVTHSLKRGQFKQNFSLSRDGLVSNTPVVPA
jgi:hypothetical protein